MPDSPLGQRIALTFVIVLAILLALALFGYLTGGWDDSAQSQEIAQSKWDARLLELDRGALDDAYHSQLQHLFAVWMKDETQQPARFASGLRQARRAYVEAMQRIEQRADSR
jgi:hypothetical protein